MECDELVNYVSDYIDNNLSEELSEAAQEHLATCGNCRVVLSSIQQMILLYREHGKTQSIPRYRQLALYNQLEEAFLQRDSDS